MPFAATADVWEKIDLERGRARFMRRVSVAAWTATFIVLVLFAILTIVQFSDAMRLAEAGGITRGTAWEFVKPLIVAAGLLSVLIATLSTIALFLRIRAASLNEIQLRLAALEQMLADRPDQP